MKQLFVTNQSSIEALAIQAVNHFKEHGSYVVEFKDFDKRSLSQNALFHMWVTEIVYFFIKHGKPEFNSGAKMNLNNMKDNLKETFLGYQEKETINLSTGEVKVSSQLRHTSELDKGEFTHFLRLVEEWAVNTHISLTLPVESEYYEICKKSGEKV